MHYVIQYPATVYRISISISRYDIYIYISLLQINYKNFTFIYNEITSTHEGGDPSPQCSRQTGQGEQGKVGRSRQRTFWSTLVLQKPMMKT